MAYIEVNGRRIELEDRGYSADEIMQLINGKPASPWDSWLTDEEEWGDFLNG